MGHAITAMSDDALAKVYRLEEAMRESGDHLNLVTTHLLHAGLYHRTLFIPSGVLVAGTLVQIDTTVIVYGNITVYVEGEPLLLTGYNVLPTYAGRKQAAYAHSDTYFTMSFATKAKTVEEAEEEFTSEFADLWSRRADALNVTMITGDR